MRQLIMNGCTRYVELMAVMEVFDGLFEADGDEEADDDGGDVDEEVAPGGGGVVGGVDVEHGELRMRVELGIVF
jgi:hypothetical protein